MGDDFAAAIAGFGAEIEDPVGFGGDGHVVLDDDDGVAFIDEAMEDVDEALDVFEVEADGGLFDQIERLRWVSAALLRVALVPRPLVSSETSLMRCASPPERVGEGWPSWR